LAGNGGGSAASGGAGITGHTSGEKIDLLFMVDNSSTMREEQDALRTQFPRLIEALLEEVDIDHDGTFDYLGARDVHLGVVSSDLGLPGVPMVDGCGGLGDGGRLASIANPTVGGCSATVYDPPFISYVLGEDDPFQAATDLTCIAMLGTSGCGFEMQLESVLKAVWPGDDSRVIFVPDVDGLGTFGQAGPGFPNGDFIRNEPDDLSLVAIVLVTDEEDCSSKDMSHLVPSTFLAPDDARAQQGLNTRCFFESQRPEPNNIYDVERYVSGFKALRPGNEALVLFGAIVGVPVDLVTPHRVDQIDYDDPSSVDQFYQDILDAPAMAYAVDDQGTPSEPADDNLVPSCQTGDSAKAYPPRRIVEVARGFGRNGFVQSICQSDFAPAMDLLVQRIAETFGPLEAHNSD
jgi:hypothetical protein